MSDRLDAALAELAAAIREEIAGADRRPDGESTRLLSIEAAAEQLGVGRTSVYQAIGRGEIRSVLIGRRRLVPVTEIAKKAASSFKADGLEVDRRERSTPTAAA